MASTREERQQMRQRGAATRKTKEVDFGFSFGGPSIGLPGPAQPAIISEPAIPSQSKSNPTPSASTAAPQTVLSQTETSQRTPGGARNHLPQRPSAYDIPPDDIPNLNRSNKRRKINPPGIEIDKPPAKSSERASLHNPSIAPNTSKTQTGPATVPTEAPQQETSENVSKLPSPPPPELHVPGGSKDAGKSTANGTEAEDHASEEQPQPLIDTVPNRMRPAKPRSPEVEMQNDSNETLLDQPAQDVASGQSKRPSRKSTSPQSNPKKKTRANAQQKPGESTKVSEPSHALPTESTIDTGDPEVAASSKQKGKNAATGKKKSGTERGTRTNGNRSKSPTAEDANADAEISSKTLDQQAQTDNPPKATRSRRGPAKDSNNTESQSPSQSPVDPAPTGAGKRRPPAKKKTQPEPEMNRDVDQEPEAESTQLKPRQGRSGKKSKRSLENHNEAETREEEVPPESEPTIVAESSKQRRGQSGKKAKRAARAEAASTQEQPDAEPEAEVEAEAETETSRRTQRKPREPRGETVPVTVHRLVNTSALTGIDTPDSDGEEGDRPADDPSAKRNAAKLPNPGGVNHADVLSQICRETLEKTLTSLKTGIENETNTARRAEWSRKRKAVEAYGMELDGRLFDLSELLDSNLVLGKQLKKAKREMMEMRSHLHRVRQKRERIALEMDQVRSEHMEKENEKTARSTINNSIHSLELALDRSHYRGSPSTEPSSNELEFLLRTVAEEVSCRAPGAQGGLLHQIRGFNAQLESTARQLERS